MSRAETEEQAIRCAQLLDLIYSQAGTLYTIIPHAPRSSNENNRLAPRPHADDMVGFVSSTTATQLVGQLGQLVLSDDPTQEAPATTTTIASTQSSKVNSVQTVKSSQPLGNKKKNNNHRKKNTSTEQTEQTNFESNVGGSKGKGKFKYPCMVC